MNKIIILVVLCFVLVGAGSIRDQLAEFRLKYDKNTTRELESIKDRVEGFRYDFHRLAIRELEFQQDDPKLYKVYKQQLKDYQEELLTDYGY